MDVIVRVKQLMMKWCDRPCSVEELCDELGVPYHTLRKLFRRSEGTSLCQYYHTVRLAKAEKMLAQPDSRVLEVAIALGFRDESYFSRWFKKRKGMAPTTFQKEVRS